MFQAEEAASTKTLQQEQTQCFQEQKEGNVTIVW